MRVLLISGSFPPMRCGVGDYTSQLALSLTRDAHLTTAVLTSRSASELTLQHEVSVLPVAASWEWKERRRILDAVREWAPDVVHIQYPTLGYGHQLLPWLLPLMLRLSGFLVIQTWHEPDLLKRLVNSGHLWRFIARGIVPGGLIVVRSDFQRQTSRLLRWAFLNKNFRYIPNASAIPSVELQPAERQALRARYSRANAHMIVFFGFIYPRKRVELLFEILDPADSHLVIAGQGFREEDLQHFPPSVLERNRDYYGQLMQLASSDRWNGKVTVTGFLTQHEAARVLAAADAVVLPVLDGGGGFNTSVHAGQAQGTFVLTTSKQRQGYDPLQHTYFAAEDDLDDMREALIRYRGLRGQRHNVTARAWQAIAESHADLYRTQLGKVTTTPAERSDEQSV